jgi:hypothetical protein
MTARLISVAAALLGFAGSLHAQPMSTWNNDAGNNGRGSPSSFTAQQGEVEGSCGHQAVIVDEYGFRYDRRGDRLNAQGCIIAPPVTLPGAGVFQNGAR